MKNFFIFSILAGLIAANAYGLLPPLYESIKEYKALIDSPELTKKLVSGELIQDIKRTDEDFVITTNKHELKVKVIYEQTWKIGPAAFHFEFEQPTPLPQD